MGIMWVIMIWFWDITLPYIKTMKWSHVLHCRTRSIGYQNRRSTCSIRYSTAVNVLCQAKKCKKSCTRHFDLALLTIKPE
jgi:hypothetical protein